MMLELHGGASISGVLSFLVMMRLGSVIQTVKYSHYFCFDVLLSMSGKINLLQQADDSFS